MTQNVTWLTQEAHDRLQTELDLLSGPARQEITDRIAAARDEGDLKENGGYHAAREEQGKNEARIRELTERLRAVRIGSPADDGVIEAGMIVTADIAGTEMTFLLGSREIADTTDLDVYSEQSPLGTAINSKKVGDKTSYTAPNGKTFKVVIKDAKPYTG